MRQQKAEIMTRLKAKPAWKQNYSDQLQTFRHLQLFSKFFLADVCFTFPPLVVIAILRRSLGQFDSSFFTDPEWSFAAIIVYGLAMTRSLELKVQYQRDRSERVFVLMRMCILGLIAAVLSLSLTQMNLAGLTVSTKCLLVFQFAVLAFGLLLLYLSHWAREDYLHQQAYLPAGLNLPRFFRFIVDDLKNLRTNADELSVRMAKRKQFTFSDSEQEKDCSSVIERQTRDIDHLISEIETSVTRLKAARVNWDTSETTVQQPARPEGTPVAGSPCSQP